MAVILQNQVCYALYSSSNVVTKAYSQLLKPLKLTYPQFVVMMALWQKDQVSVTELAQVVGISKSTMTPLLRRLERLNYISKSFVIGDDRQKSITLTTLGKSHAEGASKVAEQALCATGLNIDEVKNLLSICAKVKFNLG